MHPRLYPQHSRGRLSEHPRGFGGRKLSSPDSQLGLTGKGAVKGRISGYRGLRTEVKENHRGKLISEASVVKEELHLEVGATMIPDLGGWFSVVAK